MTLLIVLASIAAYFAVGAFYARSRAVDCYQRAKAEWGWERIARDSVTMMLLWRVVLWPYAVVFDGIRVGIRGWMMAPIESRRTEATQLRAHADSYQRLIVDCPDTVDRQLMQAGRDALIARAREIDL